LLWALLAALWRNDDAVGAASFDAMGLCIPSNHVDRLCVPNLEPLWLEIEEQRVPLAGFKRQTAQNMRLSLSLGDE
jgi:hypothetical protein